jgi:6-phosphogluconolactonase
MRCFAGCSQPKHRTNTKNMPEAAPSRLIAYVGSYGGAPGAKGGGIFGLEVAADGTWLRPLMHSSEPKEAGYLVYAPASSTLYAVDERKTDGRGPVDPPACVHAFAVNHVDGSLSWRNAQLTPGPRPTFLSYSESQKAMLSANHGDFQHVERVYRNAEGCWNIEYIYDDSTVILFQIEGDGSIGRIRDLHVFAGQGKDPNNSPQNGGHAQSNPHAHCAVIDPSGRYVLVCDKGTDRIYVFQLGNTLEVVFTLKMAEQSGPRHLAFDTKSGLAFVTCEFSSEIASLRFDPASGALTLLKKVSTVAETHSGRNEPAEVRVHPNGGLVYVNNRGEDSVAWFRADGSGQLTRLGAVPLAPSIHPGLAARGFTFDPSGTFILVADRPAHLVRSYAVCAASGALTSLTHISVPDPAFIAFVKVSEL